MIQENYRKIVKEIPPYVTLVAVSKSHPVSAIQALYDAGHRNFGENKVQELLEKQAVLPDDIRWHLIGHLQTNKVKSVIPFVFLIHSVDSEKLLDEINKQAKKINRVVDVLLQVHIASEKSKFGLSEQELKTLCRAELLENYPFVHICGLMGMATNTDDEDQVRKEFSTLKKLFDQLQPHSFSHHTMNVLSMGMSGDYSIAIEEGSNLVRIGSGIFGQRTDAY